MSKNAFDILLGSGPSLPECRVISHDISVHWFAITAKPGDACQCGKTVMSSTSFSRDTISGSSVKETKP